MFKLKVSSKEIVNRVIQVLLAIGTQLVPTAASITADTVVTAWSEFQSKDGWTKAERREFINKKLHEIKDVDLKPALADKVFDSAIDFVLEWLDDSNS